MRDGFDALLQGEGGSDDDGEDLLQPSKTQTHLDMDQLQDHVRVPTSKKALKKVAKTRAAALKNAPTEGSHLKFDDEDNAVDERQRLVGVTLDNHAAVTAAIKAGAHDLRDATLAMKQSDVIDRMVEKERLRWVALLFFCSFFFPPFFFSHLLYSSGPGRKSASAKLSCAG